MTAAAAPDGRDAVASYEALRRHVLGAAGGQPARLWLFLQEGMAAWIAGRVGDAIPSRPLTPCAGTGIRPALVRLLADSRLHRRTPYGGLP